MKKIMVLALIAMVICSIPAFANKIQDDAKSTDYVVKAPAMALRGLGNIVIAPAEIFTHGYQGTMEGRPIVGTLQGLGDGIIWCLDSVARGAWDVVTALAPKYNGAPPTHECSWK
ncbi:MAG: hypothetical protein NC930_01865 [Candidatus Omnitrophica bacterium]|nr:hypothetical protein [Candidatus Omnitrophota bacterium]